MSHTAVIVRIMMAVAYFLPAIIAVCRRHISAGPIFLFNLLLGWTVLGWILALVWSIRYEQQYD